MTSESAPNELKSFWAGDEPYGDVPAGDEDGAAALFLKRNIVIPRRDLDEVKRSTVDPDSYRVDSENVVFTSVENARMWVMRDIAVWQFLEAEASNAAIRDIRRDELARELVNDGAYAYRFADDPLKLAVDRIIDLEQAAK